MPNIYEDITARVLATMEKGVAPWRRPWTAGPITNTPHNAVSGKPYRGINVWLLMLTMWDRGYCRQQWVTYRQANELSAKAWRAEGRAVEKAKSRRGNQWVFADGDDKGKRCGGIREGQNKANGCGSTAIVFWKPTRYKDKENDGEERMGVLAKQYQVFNAEQCTPEIIRYLDRLAWAAEQSEAVLPYRYTAARELAEAWEVETKHGGDRACYVPSRDVIHLPEEAQFDSEDAYLATRFHEMVHSTGHASRLARKGVTEASMRRDHTHAEEELVAEFGAAFLCGATGIEGRTDASAAYLKSWASKLSDEPRMLMRAAQRAQKAVDLIRGEAAPVEPA